MQQRNNLNLYSTYTSVHVIPEHICFENVPTTTQRHVVGRVAPVVLYTGMRYRGTFGIAYWCDRQNVILGMVGVA